MTAILPFPGVDLTEEADGMGVISEEPYHAQCLVTMLKTTNFCLALQLPFLDIWSIGPKMVVDRPSSKFQRKMVPGDLWVMNQVVFASTSTEPQPGKVERCS